jgi:hypothetical protein
MPGAHATALGPRRPHQALARREQSLVSNATRDPELNCLLPNCDLALRVIAAQDARQTEASKGSVSAAPNCTAV